MLELDYLNSTIVDDSFNKWLDQVQTASCISFPAIAVFIHCFVQVDSATKQAGKLVIMHLVALMVNRS